ncbi:response regulator transcription factor [Moritella dasanensis]|uniref:response regulator transcription factor n=1 Tax=Moritella dasanensis TaxID=428031 RepID=UPI0002FC0376|nr:response regulator transcription factor [Moritella dasanensis]
MTYTVLVVDDEPQIHTFMRISLTAEGFHYVGATSIKSAQEAFRQERPHIVVLDLGLPDGDGAQFLHSIRKTAKTPVLILTARDQEEEKVRLFEAGANDYLSKPFGIKELIVRIKVLVRDLVQTAPLADVLVSGQLKLQKSTNQVWLDNKAIALTKKEFSFIEKLLNQPGKLVKQEEFLEDIWGHTHRDDSHYLRILVSQLRKKLNDTADLQQLIKTESGLGYRLITNSTERH